MTGKVYKRQFWCYNKIKIFCRNTTRGLYKHFKMFGVHLVCFLVVCTLSKSHASKCFPGQFFILGGSIPAPDRGVCADVVVRALRACKLTGDTAAIDLQRWVHEDMKKNFHLYPKCWGLSKPDPNIDHRRVPNLMTFFERHGKSLSTSEEPGDYHPGDIVAWQLSDGRPHIGIVVAGYGSNGWPLVVHNIGHGQQKANVLFSWKVTGHYRYLPQVELITDADDHSSIR